MIYVIMSLLVYISHFMGHVDVIIDIQTNHRK